MAKSDLIVNLNEMRKQGEFDCDELLNKLEIKHGKSIHMPLLQSAIYLDCNYNPGDLPSYIEPYRYDSTRFWG